MSILGKFLSGKRDYPSLDSSTPAAKQLESVLSPLEKLAKETSDPLEVVPAEDSVYIFLGKPPKNLGLHGSRMGKKSSTSNLWLMRRGLPRIIFSP